MKFKAKPKIDNWKPLIGELSENEAQEWLDENTDKEGYIHGWYIEFAGDGYIVGDIVDIDSDYIELEWWCPIDKATLEMVVET